MADAIQREEATGGFPLLHGKRTTSNITSKLQCSKGRISFQHQNLESLQTICYIVNRKGTTAHKGLTS